MRFSLIIPCYNEAANLPLLLERCEALKQIDGLEVILVDNGSTDETPAILAEALAGYPHCRNVKVEVNQGYGFGILAGLRAAKGEVLAWTHADLQTDPQDVAKGLEFFKSGESVFVKGRRRGRPFADVFFTIGMSAFETLLMRNALWDINAQPTMFTREFFETWQNPPHDFSLDLYASYLAKHNNIPVKRFPVFFGERTHGVSHWNVNWAAKWKFIKRTFAYSLRLKKSLVNHTRNCS
jgi:glycosyltransferase involved in cell wall biosynthesis